jgi:uncharacterized membrane protein HdeD (DUF308 family)
MDPVKQPGWLRGLEVGAGLLTIILGIGGIIFPGLNIATLIYILSFGLFLAGARSISLVGYGDLPLGQRVLSGISGIISLIFALAVLFQPGLGVTTLIVLVSYGLVVYGLGRIGLAYMLRGEGGWFSAVMAIVGVVDIILAVVVIALPGLALMTLVLLLSLALLVSGAEMIVSGVKGHN